MAKILKEIVLITACYDTTVMSSGAISGFYDYTKLSFGYGLALRNYD